jgi:hypothetical protein
MKANTSGVYNESVKTYIAINESGDRIKVNRDCTNDRIDVENCLAKNPFYPNEPPVIDPNEMFEEFMKRVQLYSAEHGKSGNYRTCRMSNIWAYLTEDDVINV